MVVELGRYWQAVEEVCLTVHHTWCKIGNGRHCKDLPSERFTIALVWVRLGISNWSCNSFTHPFTCGSFLQWWIVAMVDQIRKIIVNSKSENRAEHHATVSHSCRDDDAD